MHAAWLLGDPGFTLVPLATVYHSPLPTEGVSVLVKSLAPRAGRELERAP